jgi:hypothetical protein
LAEQANLAHWVGVIGFTLMGLSMVYSLRKRKIVVTTGTMTLWLSWHHWAGFIGGVMALAHTLGNLDGLGVPLIAILTVVLCSSGMYFLEKRARSPLREATATLADRRRERTRLDAEYRTLHTRGMASTAQGLETYRRLMSAHEQVLGSEADVTRIRGQKPRWTWWRHVHNVSTMMLMGILLVHIWTKLYYAWGGL